MENDLIGSYFDTITSYQYRVLIGYNFRGIFAGVVQGEPRYDSKTIWRSDRVMSSCVLCGNRILKNSDKNLVDGRQGTAFNV